MLSGSNGTPALRLEIKRRVSQQSRDNPTAGFSGLQCEFNSVLSLLQSGPHKREREDFLVGRQD